MPTSPQSSDETRWFQKAESEPSCGQKPGGVHLVYPCALCDITKTLISRIVHFSRTQKNQMMRLFVSTLAYRQQSGSFAIVTSLQRQRPALGHLGHVHQLAGQLLDLILARQHRHVVLVRPAVKQQPGNWRRRRQKAAASTRLRGHLESHSQPAGNRRRLTLTHPHFFTRLAYSFDPACKDPAPPPIKNTQLLL